ncbi:MAG: peptidylprolyl isomerase [Candidatus Marinimicrobia bacterium]|jgi:foldase protein PrsA|nr:peptidylprolyl isomerase [Candidatus Neomarinimicrobiota bacterium]
MIKIVIILSLIIQFACQSSTETIALLAETGKRQMHSDRFSFFYKDFLTKSGAEDNFQFRKKFLESEIDRLVVLESADSLLLLNNAELKGKWEGAGRQILLNEYFHREIFLKYQASDSLLRDAFRKSKIEIHARHLFAPTLETANQLFTRLENGTGFSVLAQEVFRDSTLAANGGDLGYFSLGEMEPAFEDAAYALKDGEISQPVKTRSGYSIIKVIDRWDEPLITEQEFQLHKKDMNALLRSRNLNSLRQKWTDSLAATLKITISENTLRYIFNRRNSILFGDTLLFTDSDLRIKSILGTWNLNILTEKLRALSPVHKSQITSPEKLSESIYGILVKEKILQLALSSSWFAEPELQWRVERNQEEILIRYTVNHFLLDIKPRLKADYTGLLNRLRSQIHIRIHEEKLRELKLAS